MSAFELRPRFILQSADSKEIIKSKVKNYLKSEDSDLQGSISDNHIFLNIPEDRQHYWSPYLSIEFSDDSPLTKLKGLFGPSPAVWTMFMFFYSGIAFIGMIGLFYGLSQWTLNMKPFGLWLVPIAVGLEIMLYLISRMGQKLAKEQMQEMLVFIQDIIKPGE